ncbi:hypothetical protein V1525DRAFT_445756 [Lipomyces kononenkoae]|uniref:Uncharacterized protein n=1 Tax=Lipomyces kononenkoae TaxID=34357 RepID=A0ACC3T8D1_LIPKO
MYHTRSDGMHAKNNNTRPPFFAPFSNALFETAEMVCLATPFCCSFTSVDNLYIEAALTPHNCAATAEVSGQVRVWCVRLAPTGAGLFSWRSPPAHDRRVAVAFPRWTTPLACFPRSHHRPQAEHGTGPFACDPREARQANKRAGRAARDGMHVGWSRTRSGFSRTDWALLFAPASRLQGANQPSADAAWFRCCQERHRCHNNIGKPAENNYLRAFTNLKVRRQLNLVRAGSSETLLVQKTDELGHFQNELCDEPASRDLSTNKCNY